MQYKWRGRTHQNLILAVKQIFLFKKVVFLEWVKVLSRQDISLNCHINTGKKGLVTIGRYVTNGATPSSCDVMKMCVNQYNQPDVQLQCRQTDEICNYGNAGHCECLCNSGWWGDQAYDIFIYILVIRSLQEEYIYAKKHKKKHFILYSSTSPLTQISRCQIMTTKSVQNAQFSKLCFNYFLVSWGRIWSKDHGDYKISRTPRWTSRGPTSGTSASNTFTA